MKFLADMNRGEALLFHWDIVAGNATQVWFAETSNPYWERVDDISCEVSAGIAELFLHGYLEFLVDDKPPQVLMRLKDRVHLA